MPETGGPLFVATLLFAFCFSTLVGLISLARVFTDFNFPNWLSKLLAAVGLLFLAAGIFAAGVSFGDPKFTWLVAHSRLTAATLLMVTCGLWMHVAASSFDKAKAAWAVSWYALCLATAAVTFVYYLF